MTTRAQSDFLTRTGPRTPMGDLLRRYWIPALLVQEVPEPDCPPVRVKLMSERLLAFRDTQGRVGVIDEFCAHRGVSLWFARNEESGLRCPYHGWKYDVAGQCVDVPSEPAESGFCNRIRLKSYPCVELGGVIWVYMGPPERKPPLPAFEWVQVAHAQRFVSKRTQECNYLQAMEGGIDSAFHRLEIIAFLGALGDETLGMGNLHPLEGGQRRLSFRRSHIDPDDAAELDAGIGLEPDPITEAALRRLRGNV